VCSKPNSKQRKASQFGDEIDARTTKMTFPILNNFVKTFDKIKIHLKIFEKLNKVVNTKLSDQAFPVHWDQLLIKVTSRAS